MATKQKNQRKIQYANLAHDSSKVEPQVNPTRSSTLREKRGQQLAVPVHHLEHAGG